MKNRTKQRRLGLVALVIGLATVATGVAFATIPAANGVIQIATFFGSDGTVTIDPDGDGPFFETPIAGPLPEELNYIP